jgi:hypothetical protein
VLVGLLGHVDGKESAEVLLRRSGAPALCAPVMLASPLFFLYAPDLAQIVLGLPVPHPGQCWFCGSGEVGGAIQQVLVGGHPRAWLRREGSLLRQKFGVVVFEPALHPFGVGASPRRLISISFHSRQFLVACPRWSFDGAAWWSSALRASL